MPLAAAGGIFGLWLVDHLLGRQPLDILRADGQAFRQPGDPGVPRGAKQRAYFRRFLERPTEGVLASAAADN